MKTLAWLGTLLLALGCASPLRAAMPTHPALHATTLDGKPFDLAAERGHWVIVNFWATWCVPCIAEMPELSHYVKTHPAVRAVGIAYDDSEPADIRAFLAKHPVVYPVVQVTLDKPLKDFDEPRGLPTTWLIAPDGTVATHFLGPVTGHMLDAAMAAGKR